MREQSSKSRLDLSRWDRRNLWPLPDGDLAVRPGLRRVLTLVGAVDGHSVINPINEAVLHYIITDNGTGTVQLHCYDEVMALQWSYTLATNAPPARLCVSMVGVETIISGPGMPTLYLETPISYPAVAVPQDSKAGVATQDVPQGLSVAIAQRVVYAEAGTIYYSDAGRPRAIVGVNFAVGPWMGTVYGLHRDRDGALIIVAGNGVFRQSIEMFGQAQSVVKQFPQVGHYQARDYRDTMEHKGTIFGLTRDGMQRVAPYAPDELGMSEGTYPRSLDNRLHVDDWRQGRAIDSQLAPMAAWRDYLFMSSAEMSGWWQMPDDNQVRACLVDEKGRELLLCDKGVFEIVGNADADADFANEHTVTGYLSGVAQQGVVGQISVTHTHCKTDSVGTVTQAVNGTSRTGTAHQQAPVIGTASWGSASTLQRPPEMDLIEETQKERATEVALEFAIENPLSRIGLVGAVTSVETERRTGS